MKQRTWSLRTAVMIPIIIITFLVLVISVYSSARDYEFLAREQGSKILEALYENTEMRLSALLMEPQSANEFYAYYISNTGLYNYDTMDAVESFTLDLMKRARVDMPQISAMSYGDELRNFAGFRLNEDQTYGLMLKDARTQFNLDIYRGESSQSERLAFFEEYDPTTRPWYAPVKDHQEIQWSEVYVNYDEKMELTITSLVPVFDNQNIFRGVAGTDVKLNMINDFLIDEKMKGSGAIYIIDRDFNLIAHSLEENYVKVIEGDPPTAVMVPANEVSNEIVNKSAVHIMENTLTLDETIQLTIGDERYFARMSSLRNPSGLNWSIVAVIPESDIMGTVKKRQDATFQFTAVVLVASMLVAMYVLNLVTLPILQSSEAALALSGGNFDTKLELGKFQLYETRELVMAFNNMATELRSTFSKLKKSETKYRTLIENVDSMIYNISSEGVFLSMNKSFEKSLPFSNEDLIGQHFNVLIEENSVFKESRDYFYKTIESKATQEFQVEYMSFNNVRKIMSVRLVPQFDDDGEVVSVLGTNTDITDLVLAQEHVQRLLTDEKNELERMVKERTEELEATMEELIDRERLASLGSLVAGIAHEVNTPLGVAVTAGSYMDKINSGILEKLHAGTLSKKDLMEFLRNIEESSEIINTNLARASELVRSFKEISVNQSAETISDFAVCDTIHDVLLALKHEYKNTKHDFVIECDNALRLKSYYGALSQILTNLIMNSLIHGFEGIEKGHIYIRAKIENQEFVLEYEDDGNGISKDNIAYIFDPFFTTNRNRGGSGLGLSIVYNIVTGKLGGRIQCQSDMGSGTLFSIRMPAVIDIDTHTQLED